MEPELTEAQSKAVSTWFDEGMAVAEKLFDAYNNHGPNPWKTFDGRDVPRFKDCSTQVQGKWHAA